MRWIEWNRYFQGHPPSRVRGESVAAAATLLSVAITSSLARVVQPGLGAGRLTFLANPATALSTLLLASWSIKSYCLPTQAIIDEPPLTLVLNACPRLRSSHLPPSRALGFRHTAKSTIHLPLPISKPASDPIIVRASQFRSSLHCVSLVIGPHPRLARRSPPLSRNKPPNYSRLPS